MLYISDNEETTLGIAEAFADNLVPGDIVLLNGDLGAGKTVFARGIARGLAIDTTITSPTFTLIHEYNGSLPMYHMDLYRMKNLTEVLELGVEEYLYGDGVCLIEWPEKLEDIYPDDAYEVQINHCGASRREINIEGRD